MTDCTSRGCVTEFDGKVVCRIQFLNQKQYEDDISWAEIFREHARIQRIIKTKELEAEKVGK